MKRIFKLLVLFPFVFGYSLHAQTLKDGNFENNNGCWTFKVAEHKGAEAKLTCDTTERQEGIHSAKIEIKKLGSENWDISLLQTGLSLKDNTNYWVVFYAKAKIQGAKIVLMMDTSSNPKAKMYRMFELNTEWTKYVTTVSTTDISASAEKVFAIWPSSEGVLYIDNIQFNEGIN